MKFKIIIIFILSFAYSFLRYNIFGNVPFYEIPTVIINKSISFSSIFILLLSSFSLIKNKNEEYNFYINIFKITVYIHIFLSLAIFSQPYFPKIFIENKLNFLGNMLVLSGVLSIGIISSKQFKFSIIYLFFFFLFHVYVLGYQVWLTPDKWNGLMPPITLISFVLIMTNLLIILKNKSRIVL